VYRDENDRTKEYSVPKKRDGGDALLLSQPRLVMKFKFKLCWNSVLRVGRSQK